LTFLLPQVCATFKGVSPSVFAERWGDPEVGKYCMEIDMAVAAEIAEQIAEAQESSKGSKSGLRDRAKGAVARRKQRRARRGD
jgi:hypothetical protein